MRLSIMQAAIGHRHIAGGGDKPAPSGYRGGTGSSVGIGGAIAVHALVIGAWLLIPKEVIDTVITRPFETYAVPEEKAPPPEPVDSMIGDFMPGLP